MRRVLAVSLALNGLLGLGLLGALYGERLVVHADGDVEGRGAGTPAGNGDVNADGTYNLSDAVYILTWLFMGGPEPYPIESSPAGEGGLPATGQTECQEYVEGQGWATLPCTEAEISGQDGAYQAGCPMAGRFVDHGDGTVTDTCTGLVWQRDIADVNGDGAITDDLQAGDRVAWREALEYCESLSFAGYEDWRLPNVRELQSIMDYGLYDPAVDPTFHAVSRYHWSSSPYTFDPEFAWGVDSFDGSVYMDLKGFVFHFRAVRGGT
jgi:hypothetical protein